MKLIYLERLHKSNIISEYYRDGQLEWIAMFSSLQYRILKKNLFFKAEKLQLFGEVRQWSIWAGCVSHLDSIMNVN